MKEALIQEYALLAGDPYRNDKEEHRVQEILGALSVCGIDKNDLLQPVARKSWPKRAGNP